MKRQELILMNQQERDRLQILQQARKRRITQGQAAAQMEVSERWVRELLRRMKKRGDRVVVHGLRGRVGNRKIAEPVRARALRVVKREYGDFGPTLASEYLAQREGIAVSRETLRGWMLAAGLWRRRRARIERVHQWRARRAQCGELVQWDTSEHDWLEGRGGEKLYLILMIDDASSRALARFVRHDSTEENMRTLRSYLERWGRPLAWYTDKASLFRVNRPARVEEELAGEPARTQIGRALHELGMEWIAAHSPQAKGRVERFFRTAQDRLVKGLRTVGASTLEAAQQYLERVYLPLWNRRFTVEPTNSSDAHRPLAAAHDLAAILSRVESRVESRVAANDYTLRWQGQLWQIAREEIGPGLRGAQVRVEQRLDGAVWVRFRNRYLTVRRCDAPPRRRTAPRTPPPRPARTTTAARRQHWMKGFPLDRAKPIWAVLHDERAGPVRNASSERR